MAKAVHTAPAEVKMNDSRNSEEKRFLRLLQQMVSLIGLDRGKMRMEVHHDHIAAVRITSQTTLLLDVVAADEVAPLTMSDAKNFVVTRLQPAVPASVRPYGRINATVRRGIVEQMDLTKKLRHE